MGDIPTINDIASLCGVSKGTVSKALNARTHLVSPTTRAHILSVAESIGFKPSWRARALANRRSQMIAVLNSAVKEAVPRNIYPEIYDRLDPLLGEHDYSMVFIHAKEAFPRLERMLSDGRFDGVLTLGIVAKSVMEMVRRQRLPAVLINSNADASWTRIAVDDKEGALQGMRHLLSLGHKRIAYRMDVLLEHPAWTERIAGYREALQEAGLPSYEPHVGTEPEFVRWLLAQPAAQRPTAVIDHGYTSAICLLQSLWRQGLRVPNDISVVTFGDTYPVAELIPPLTTLALPSAQIAELGAQMILDCIASGEAEPQTVVLPETLVIRESTAPPPDLVAAEPNRSDKLSRVSKRRGTVQSLGAT